MNELALFGLLRSLVCLAQLDLTADWHSFGGYAVPSYSGRGLACRTDRSTSSTAPFVPREGQTTALAAHSAGAVGDALCLFVCTRADVGFADVVLKSSVRCCNGCMTGVPIGSALSYFRSTPSRVCCSGLHRHADVPRLAHRRPGHVRTALRCAALDRAKHISAHSLVAQGSQALRQL
jgi:hypothetical protein